MNSRAVLNYNNPREDEFIRNKLSRIPQSQRVLLIGSNPLVISLHKNDTSYAVRGLLYDAHKRFGAPSPAYELPRDATAPTTTERVQLLAAVVDRSRALGVEIKCDLSAHRARAAPAAPPAPSSSARTTAKPAASARAASSSRGSQKARAVSRAS